MSNISHGVIHITILCGVKDTILGELILAFILVRFSHFVKASFYKNFIFYTVNFYIAALILTDGFCVRRHLFNYTRAIFLEL